MQLNGNKKAQLKHIAILFFFAIILIVPFFSIYSKATNPSRQNSATTATASNTATVTDTSCCTGAYLIVTISSQDLGSSTNPTVTDSLGNSFTASVQDSASGFYAGIWIAQQTHIVGSDTITVTFSSTTHNVTVAVFDFNNVVSTTPDVTAVGSGTTANPISTSSVTPSFYDACFTSGIARASTNNAQLVPNAPDNSPVVDSGFTVLFQSRLTATAADSFATFSDYPAINTATTFSTNMIVPATGTLTALAKWELVAACYKQPTVTTTTITLTSMTTNTTTTTGTALPEPAGSTDFNLLLLALIIAVIMMIIAFYYKNPFPALVASFVLLGAYLGLNSNPTIIIGNNSIALPVWFTQVWVLFIVVSFVYVFYLVFKWRTR